MSLRRIVPASVLLSAMAACRATQAGQEAGVAALTSLFGPVVSSDVIRGRADDKERVWLLAGDRTLIDIDLTVREARPIPIALAAGESCWGLARPDDGSLWTLKGRTVIAQIDLSGGLRREIALGEPHLNVFAAGRRLVYQKAAQGPGAPLLTAGLPGTSATEPWSAMKARAFAGFARPQSTALNMVACGATAGAERPCWFPDEAAVSLITTSGDTRRVTLSGLALIAPEVLLAAENPRRPIRDAFVDDRRRIWILSSGEPPPGNADRPGGWILARYLSDGTPDGRARLQEPARLLLRADDRRVLLLSGAGHVSEVRPW
jgi:hypothetical protein